MTHARVTFALGSCLVLCACGVDASLGRHEPSLRHDDSARGAGEADTGASAPHAVPDAALAAPSAHDAGPTEPQPPEVVQDASLHEPPPEEPPPEEPPPEEPPPEEPPPEEPPPEEPPPELPVVCTAATDNACLLCEQDACCDALFACSEHEVCHCRLECRGTAEPGACAEGCGPAPDVLSALDACIAEHCAEHCPL